MPWKECNIVEVRLRFIARLLDGEKMSGLCREFAVRPVTKKNWWRSVATAVVFAPVAGPEEWPTVLPCWWTRCCRINPYASAG